MPLFILEGRESEVNKSRLLTLEEDTVVWQPFAETGLNIKQEESDRITWVIIMVKCIVKLLVPYVQQQSPLAGDAVTRVFGIVFWFICPYIIYYCYYYYSISLLTDISYPIVEDFRM
jgi:hypothetical protein